MATMLRRRLHSAAKGGGVEGLLQAYRSRVMLPVQWGDMDAFGHVNNVQYFRYLESSRIQVCGGARAGTSAVRSASPACRLQYFVDMGRSGLVSQEEYDKFMSRRSNSGSHSGGGGDIGSILKSASCDFKAPLKACPRAVCAAPRTACHAAQMAPRMLAPRSIRT